MLMSNKPFFNSKPFSFSSKSALARASLASVCMRSASAEAATKPGHTDRTKKILDHVSKNPMKLQSKPMIYEKDPPMPLPDVCKGLKPEDVKPSPNSHDHWAVVCAALLYAACGGLDHAHNLCTPLSWPAPTSYGGPPVRGSPAAKEAAYVHAITHRMEGLCDGEFGDGYSNANFWYGSAGSHDIHVPLLQKAKEYAAGNPKLEKLVENHGSSFSPYKFVSVCQQAEISKEPELVQFCEKVGNTEWRMLFDHVHAKL